MGGAIGVLIGTAALMAATAIPAVAQEPGTDDVNCFPLLSSLVCHIPVSVPIGPFEFTGPFIVVESIFRSEG
jgi:hypothetical protein